MLNQMSTMNDVLQKVYGRIRDNADLTIDFLKEINEGNERVRVPIPESLEEYMHELSISLEKQKNKNNVWTNNTIFTCHYFVDLTGYFI